VVGIVSDTALSIIGPPYEKYRIDIYSTMELVEAVDMFKVKLHEYTKHIYYKRNGDDDISDQIMVKITTKPSD
jgi:hypothetical protein